MVIVGRGLRIMRPLVERAKPVRTATRGRNRKIMGRRPDYYEESSKEVIGPAACIL